MTLTGVKVWLLAASAVWTASAALSMPSVMLSPALLDALDTGHRAMAITLALSVATFPLLCGLAIALSWVALYLRSRELAIGGTLLPLLNLIIAASILWLR